MKRERLGVPSMRNMVVSVLAGALVISVSPVLAANLPAPAYDSKPFFNWTGLYAGVNGGFGFGTSRWTAGGTTTGDFDVSGWMVGGTLGYNWQHGNIVLGVEGDVDWSGISGTTTNTCSRNTCETENNWLGTARVRLGYATGNWLPYVTGGVAVGDVAEKPIMANNTHPTNTATQVGWTVGVGIEWALPANWSAKLNYLYVDLPDAPCGSVCVAGGKAAFKTSIVRVGLNRRF